MQEIFDTFSSFIFEKKSNLQEVLDIALVQTERQKEDIETLIERLLIERQRHEQLQKESEKLDLELLALQSSENDPDITTKSIGDEGTLTEHSSLSNKPFDSLLSPFYSESLFQTSVDRGKEPTVSDIEEIQREINENLTVFQEAALQLKKEQEAGLSKLIKVQNY